MNSEKLIYQVNALINLCLREDEYKVNVLYTAGGKVNPSIIALFVKYPCKEPVFNQKNNCLYFINVG